MHDWQWVRGIQGGLSVQAIADYLQLWSRLAVVQLQPDQDDQCIWRWTSNGQYSAKSAYMMLNQGLSTFSGHKLIWQTWTTLKVKIFLWLAFRQRHWMADRRERHDLETHTQIALSMIKNLKHRRPPVHLLYCDYICKSGMNSLALCSPECESVTAKSSMLDQGTVAQIQIAASW